MHFTSLRAANLRCFPTLVYEPHAGCNLIYGANGSGKTTILEAFHLLSCGKSFLTNRASDLVKQSADVLCVDGRVREILGVGAAAVEVRKSRGATEISFDGQLVTSASALARYLPLFVINSRAPDLLSDNPSSRRALLDRSLFHVKHTYVDTWKQYRNALRQRNVLLQRTDGGDELVHWERVLTTLSTSIDEQRASLVRYLNERMALSSIPGFENQKLHFEYNPGWDRRLDFFDQLREDRDRDANLGFTVAGPHRADLSLQINGRAASRRLSRGQSKTVVCLVIAAIVEFIQKSSGASPVVLIDDLSAEMDNVMLAYAVQAILSVETQCFFTAIKPADIRPLLPDETFMFHVERKIH